MEGKEDVIIVDEVKKGKRNGFVAYVGVLFEIKDEGNSKGTFKDLKDEDSNAEDEKEDVFISEQEVIIDGNCSSSVVNQNEVVSENGKIKVEHYVEDRKEVDVTKDLEVELFVKVDLKVTVRCGIEELYSL